MNGPTANGSGFSSAKLARHPFNLRYIYLRIVAALIRTLVVPIQTARILSAPQVDGVKETTIRIPSREKGEKGRWIAAKVFEPAQGLETTPAVHVNLHGSGFLIPSLGSDVEFLRYATKRLNCIIIDADYRKAPEHPFPAAGQDVEDVLHYVHAHPELYDIRRVTVGGFSAGGGLALVVAHSLGSPLVCAVASVYPSTDFSVPRQDKIPPRAEHDGGVVLPAWLTKHFDWSYLLANQDRKDPRVSPIYAPASAFPPHVFVACGDADTLHNDAKRFVEKIKQGGHPDAVFMSIGREAHAWDQAAKKGTISEKRRDEAWNGVIETIQKGWKSGLANVK